MMKHCPACIRTISSSRWGIKEEDLGGGYGAFFALESEVHNDTGALEIIRLKRVGTFTGSVKVYRYENSCG